MGEIDCIICKHDAKEVFEKPIFSKNIKYYLCSNCGFLFTQRPTFWLEQAYTNAITSLDLGLVNRNLLYSEVLAWYIKICGNEAKKFLDFGGGYGLLTRIMRDKGYNFYRQDMYCENLFAKSFDISDLNTNTKFDLLTAFEVFEHLDDPLSEVKKMFQYSDVIFFSTELSPSNDLKNWYYLAPEIGQHISFYSEGSLKEIAKVYDATYYKLDNTLHVLSKIDISGIKIFLVRKFAMNYLRAMRKIKFNNKRSLLASDFDSVKKKLVS